MWRIVLVIGLVLLFHPLATHAQSKPKHGGKIESRYDGFNYETLARLHKMKVSCDGVGDIFQKDACVSIDVTLRFPGSQLNYVRNVTLQVIFENKDWVRIHPLEQRDLSISTDSETFRLGRMNLITNKKPGQWDTKIEVLEATNPYETFKKIALAMQVEIKVGPGAVILRENNVAALRDLNSRVIPPTSNSSTGTSAKTLSSSPDK
jgi:hypothetical protein